MNKSVGLALVLTIGLVAPAWTKEVKCPISTIAFTSTRDYPAPPVANNLEIYLMDGDGTNPRRLTEDIYADGQPHLSPDGKGRVVFDSNRARAAGEPLNTSDLFLTDENGIPPTLLTRGSSATWSPDGKRIAFHRSASFTVPGTGKLPIRPDGGAPTLDSDIFVAKVKDLLKGKEPKNLTFAEPRLYIHDDADWSPDGTKIAYTRHGVNDSHQNSITAEICVIDAKGKEDPVCYLGDNDEEERGPAWSPDGTRIAYMCRKGPGVNARGLKFFAICTINADGTGEKKLTAGEVFDATPVWSPDGLRILFARGETASAELWVMNAADGSEQTQFTDTNGANGGANWGVITGECKHK